MNWAGWFMVDAEFKPMHAIRLYVTLFTYAFLFTVLGQICGEEHSLQLLVPGLSPFFWITAWFATAYISLILLSPFLKKVLDLDRKALRLLCVILLVVVSVLSCTIMTGPIDYLGDFLWFVCVYVFMSYLKRHTAFPAGMRPVAILLLTFGGYASLILLEYFSPGELLPRLLRGWLRNIRCVPNFLISLGVFALFARMRPRHSRIVNALAKSAFAVYILQQIPAVACVLWPWLARHTPFASNTIPGVLANFLVFPAAIYLSGWAIDRIWSTLAGEALLRSGPVKWLEGRMQKLYDPVCRADTHG